MIEMIQIKNACNGILRNAFPSMKIYGTDSTEGLERPCFYTEIVPYTLTYETINRVHQSCGFKISILEKKTDEAFQLTALATIRKAFGLKLPVEDRKITITDVDFETTGKNNDVFQITITFEWYDSIAEADTHPIMERVLIDEELK